MKVHGARLSPFVRKVFTVLELKGLPYEQFNVLPATRTPEFLKISPLGRIPGFEDGDLAISDSTVICEYLEEQYPAIPTLPASPADRARARWLEEYCDTRLMDLCGAGYFWEVVVKPKMLGQPTDEAKVQRTVEKLLPPELDYLNAQMPADGFLFGEFGRADISVASPLINMQYAGYVIDTARWPQLAAFVERVKAHPVVAGLMAIEAKIFAKLG